MVRLFMSGVRFSMALVACCSVASADQQVVVSGAVGACCDSAAGTCVPDVTESDCQGVDQHWLEGATCEAADCGSPFGACCFEDTDHIEKCRSLPESLCLVVGNQNKPRVWQGGEGCAVNNQSCPLIACLGREGSCLESRVEPGCADSFCCSEVCRTDFDDFCCRFEWDEFCVAIAQRSCGLGACCELRTGTCVDDVSRSECSRETETYFPGEPCSELVCEPAVGACCDTTAGGGATCLDNVLFDDCAGAHFEFSADQSCASVGCVEATGSCCDRRDGTCAEGIKLGDCSAPADRWLQDIDCAQAFCFAESAACCDRLRGTCTRSTLADCNCDQCEWLFGERCEDIVCDAGFLAIPATSQWGLAVLALLLLSAAKIAFAGRAATTD